LRTVNAAGLRGVNRLFFQDIDKTGKLPKPQAARAPM
jgi:hypothetical protein